ncbi:MAG: SGNH/GDSL hydrolase family protein [Ruminococcaceae bacterium]|nr:SGNH/GDSL hydrolase family protein [Oscillospiraceae bacterium]
MKKLLIIILSLLLVSVAFMPSAAATANSAPQLQETSCVENNGVVTCLVQFKSIAGKKYRVYRRAPYSGKYAAIGDIQATENTTRFRDKKAKKGAIYFYTVRMINGKKKLGAFDKKGIKAICHDCAPTIRLTTMNAQIRFTATPEATSYQIFRKFNNGDFKQIGMLTAAQAKASPHFVDTFRLSLKTAAEKEYLISDTFVDPTANPFRYEVRAFFKSKTDCQIARGYYSKSGTCVVATPAISAVTVGKGTAQVSWAGVPVAKSYNIYGKVDQFSAWKKLATVINSDQSVQRHTVSISQDFAYYTVRAFALSHGILVAGEYETDFAVSQRNIEDKKALFIGDSITKGIPYKESGFTAAARVQQLLGIHCDNFGIGGATISDTSDYTLRSSILINELLPLCQGQVSETSTDTYDEDLPSLLWDYDYIVIQGGTNDYGYSVPIGETDSADITTFNGALNQMREILTAVNDIRINMGLEPVKVIAIEITFSYRFGSVFTELNNRFTFPNKLGLTALDYNEAFLQSMSNSEFDVTFVQTTPVINEENCIYESIDNLHLTRLGYSQLGNLIAEAIAQ